MVSQLLGRRSTWLIGYAITLVLIAVALQQARHRVLAQQGDSQAQADWERWRAEAERQSGGSGPVSRRAPQNGEPPELVLLRDHFFVSLCGLVLLTTALFGSLSVMVRGVLAGPSFHVTADKDLRQQP